jgi:sugar (pentulose or hexulose) kinase
MAEPLRCVRPETVIAGYDFSTGSVKALAFDLQGNVLGEVRLPTDLATEGGVCELNLFLLEGQARASTRALARRLLEQNRLQDWAAAAVSATHHTAGRIDEGRAQVRRAICWNDQTLAPFHARGLARLGGQAAVRDLIGGPWAVRYSLSHLVKDEAVLPPADWRRTRWVLPHGPLAVGFLTGRFGVTSVSAAASTGIMDLRSKQWCLGMLDALENPEYRALAARQLPTIVDSDEPLAPLSGELAEQAGLRGMPPPLVFSSSDDQAAGLVGGGAVDAGQMAVILGNSAVVNSSSVGLPATDALDAMRLNWGPYLWMRCYSNGAQFLDRVVGPSPDWAALERAARAVPAGSGGVTVLPFVLSEPSLGVDRPRFQWLPAEPTDPGVRFRAALEALAYLIALGVRAHEQAGQSIGRVTVSGGIARSELMGEILASVLGRRLERLQSDEGPALGAAVTALAGLEAHLRRIRGIAEPFTVGDAVGHLVRFRSPVEPVEAWRAAYAAGLEAFERAVRAG